MKERKFGKFGGRFVPEPLMAPIQELEEEYNKLKEDESFKSELNHFLERYAGRPTPLTFSEDLSQKFGCKVYLKREDLLHGGAHKLNNTLGQALLARYMGKDRIIAETGAGQHGVATAVAGAKLDLETEIFMGEEDIERQEMNVFRMRLLGAKVTPVETGEGKLKDAVNEALRDWVSSLETTHYLIGSVVGPHPFPTIVRDFQSVIGRETREQMMEREDRVPDYIIACVGGGSNAIGIFHEFVNEDTELIGVEAEGASSLNTGSEGVLHGSLSQLLQDEDGQIGSTESIAAGLDYPGVGPEHSMLEGKDRVNYVTASDTEAVEAFKLLSREEGIIPALESSHALAHLPKLKEKLGDNGIVVVNLSGRGDKDVEEIPEEEG